MVVVVVVAVVVKGSIEIRDIGGVVVGIFGMIFIMMLW